MQITKFTTMQNNHASATQKILYFKNKMKQLKSPGLVASYDLWPGNRAGPILQGKEKKGKEEYLYSTFLAKEVHSKRPGMDHTVLPANNTMPAFPS